MSDQQRDAAADLARLAIEDYFDMANMLEWACDVARWWINEATTLQSINDGYSQAFNDQHAEIERLTLENARLQSIVDALPGLIEAQASSLLPTLSMENYLDMWDSENGGDLILNNYYLQVTPFKKPSWVFYRCPSEKEYFNLFGDSFVVGTDECPATPNDLIQFFLAKWKETYPNG